jgi:DNA repair protein RadA/Sms
MMISDPGVDLGLLLAVAASYMGQAIPAYLVCVGEVGLLGEIRRVKLLEKREKEAKRLGRKQFLGPNQVKTVKIAISQLLQAK